MFGFGLMEIKLLKFAMELQILLAANLHYGIAEVNFFGYFFHALDLYKGFNLYFQLLTS